MCSDCGEGLILGIRAEVLASPLESTQPFSQRDLGANILETIVLRDPPAGMLVPMFVALGGVALMLLAVGARTFAHGERVLFAFMAIVFLVAAFRHWPRLNPPGARRIECFDTGFVYVRGAQTWSITYDQIQSVRVLQGGVPGSKNLFILTTLEIDFASSRVAISSMGDRFSHTEDRFQQWAIAVEKRVSCS